MRSILIAEHMRKMWEGNLCTYSLNAAESFKKLIGSQPVNKFPAFYETRKFITAFTSARHLSLS